MSSFLGAGGTCGFNLDFIKSPSSSSAYSSTLSKSSSVTSLPIPTKRARTPRKRPNQAYIEAAILLSTACPNVFSAKNLHKKYSGSLSSLSSSSLSSSEVPFSSFNEADFLIKEPSPETNPLKIKPVAPVEESESCVASREASPPGSPGYDVNSIFDDEAGEGIDSITGKLSMDDCDSNSNIFPCINPFVGSPMGLGLAGKLGIDFGVGQHIRQALRGTQSEDWLKPAMMVQMQDIVPKFNALPSSGKKMTTKKKKKKVEEVKDEPEVIKITAATGITTSPFKLLVEMKSGLGLKLNHVEVIKAWGDRRSPFSSDSGTPESSAEISARLAEIDLSPDNEGGRMREASVHRYLEKKKVRHFSNNSKIRYQVRKVNADCKPRMKGRFVKKTHFLHEAMGEES